MMWRRPAKHRTPEPPWENEAHAKSSQDELPQVRAAG